MQHPAVAMSVRSMKRQSSAGSFFADEALTEAAVLAIRHETNSAVNSRSVLHTGEPPVTWKGGATNLVCRAQVRVLLWLRVTLLVSA